MKGARVALPFAAGLLFVALPARAVDPFEIQVYDGEANEPGAFGIELHVNSVAVGPSVPRVTTEYPEAQQTHFTLEPSLGLFKWWELGAYFQAALRGDSAFDYAGAKLRSKFVTPEGWDPHFRLGANFELSLLPVGYDAGRWAGELRPIAAWENDHFLFAINPIVDVSFAGPDAHEGPYFEPCFEALLKLHESVSFGVEYYSNLGPFSGLLPWQRQEQYVYEVFNLLSIPHLELNVGVGEGLTDASNRFVAKAIVGYTWEKDHDHAEEKRAALPVGLRGVAFR